MVKITDQEPITDSKGKILYENELDRVKKMYKFLPPTPYGLDIAPEELARRQVARLRNKRNKAR